MNKTKKQQGFTIIELLIATAVFSTVLLIAATGIVHIGKLFQKGITSSLTQEVARNTMDEIKNDFEYSGGDFRRLAPNGANQGFCIGSRLYSYRLNNKIDGAAVRRTMVVRDFANCDMSPIAAPDDVIAGTGRDPITGSVINVSDQMREFLGQNMRLYSFSVDETPTGSPEPTGLQIAIDVVSGDDDLISAGRCSGGAGSQYCANSPLVTYAVKRLR